MTGHTVITGGAGFIGTNMAARLCDQGERVVIFDDLSRRGVEANLRWLRQTYGDRVSVEIADVADQHAVRRALVGAQRVYHFAAQVAVTTSVTDPRHDFRVNLGGTVNLLEEIRRSDNPPPLLFTSTNKVYGNLADVAIERRGQRYEPADDVLRARGIGEERPLHFCSPYGCSKGGADQYVLDYAASYGLDTLVFRMSCIYGPHQCGNEDQGWVAHFLMRAQAKEKITIYGDGRQVRDILFVDDLLDAMQAGMRSIERVGGRAYNIGGGPSSTVSLLELLELIEELDDRSPDVDFGPWRVGDQQYYVSDIRALEAATGWRPHVGVREGVRRLHEWLRESRSAQRLTEAV